MKKKKKERKNYVYINFSEYNALKDSDFYQTKCKLNYWAFKYILKRYIINM